MSKNLRVIVGGYLGLLPAGGVTWDYIQYPAGFAELGCDVYYIEDTRLWPVFQSRGADPGDCSPNIAHLSAVMSAFGLADRWSYRDEASGRCFGLSSSKVREICRSADLFVNVSCSTFMREEYLQIPARILIDSDPMFTQVQYVTHSSFTPGKTGMRSMVDAHTHHFTFGENVHHPDCRMPHCGLSWQPTRQPICLSHWEPKGLPANGSGAYTTVMNWSAAPPLEFEGQQWGQKNVEFMHLLSLPGKVPDITLAVAVGQTTGPAFPAQEARRHGWEVLDPSIRLPDWNSYRRFIEDSAGEFSVAKETYVKANTGWFSCRSACYLAAGRPVVTQDTGWSRYLPHDCGLLGFRHHEQAVEALLQVHAEPQRHARRARQIAEEFFDSKRVLADLLQRAGA
jgi:hypothetical protein